MTATATTQQNKTRFWSDDFDMDLSKILPGLRDRIGSIAGCPLYTWGSLGKEGVFSHPACWWSDTGLCALFFIDEPALEKQRDEHGWVNIGGCVTSDPLCEVTVWDAIRDCWLHTYELRLEGRNVLAMSTRFYNSHLSPLMSDVRGYRKLPDDVRRRMLEQVEGWAIQGARNISTVVEQHCTLAIQAMKGEPAGRLHRDDDSCRGITAKGSQP